MGIQNTHLRKAKFCEVTCGRIGTFTAQLLARLCSSRLAGILWPETSSTQGASFTLRTTGLQGRLVVDTVALRTKLAEYFPGEGTDKVPKPLQVWEEAGTDGLKLIPERLAPEVIAPRHAWEQRNSLEKDHFRLLPNAPS